MDSLKELCEKHHSSGLYTHVYVACGFLDDQTNTYSYEILPEGRMLFDLSSLTKAFVTTPLTLWECFDYGFHPEEKSIKDIFGAMSLSELGLVDNDLTPAHFLRHETGLPFWRNFYVLCDEKKQTIKECLSRCQVDGHAPDVYSDIGFIVLGELLARRHSTPLFKLWQDRCLAINLSAAKECHQGSPAIKNMAISTGACPVRQRDLVGEVHDENAYALGGFTGHTGLFASGETVSKFLRELWSQQSGRKIYMSNFEKIDSKGESLMGWRKGRDSSSKPFANGRACGHMGFTGTAFWVDPLTRSYAVVLTNRIISGRLNPKIKDFRAAAFAHLWSMIQN